MERLTMREYDFALVATFGEKYAKCVDEVCEIADTLYELGADDCTVSATGRSLILSFDREANNYEEAVLSAIKQVNKIEGVTVKSVDAGQYVGLSDAAELSELTRSALSKFNKGDRGDGTFPSPYLRVGTKTPLFDWAEIAKWLEERQLVESGIAENARFTSNINMALKLKNGELEEVSRLVSKL
jgi:hypothetical protein